MSVTYRTSIEADIAILAPNIREHDRHEIYCSHGVTPLEALTISFSNSVECYTIEDHNGSVVGMFGVTKHTGIEAIPWLLATDALPKKENQRSFLTQGKDWITDIKSRYEKLSNRVHADNRTSIRWLKSLGFSFDQEVIWGYRPSRFIRFYWNR